MLVGEELADPQTRMYMHVYDHRNLEYDFWYNVSAYA